MLTPGRPFQVLVLLAIMGLFYLTGPFSTLKPDMQKRESNADARLARWVEVATSSTSQEHIDKPRELPNYVSDFYTQRPVVSFNPFPLGRLAVASADAPQTTIHGLEFSEMKFSFQEELNLPLPRIRLRKYKDYAPRNYKPNEKQETFATYLSTRNSSIHDPYFAATLNLIYRNLWAPGIASKSRPFTVFVAPHIPQQQREIFEGAGAIVKELGLLPWKPNVEGVSARWRDQFSKINMWGQTQYKTIAFMDSDAFPIKNIDAVFDEAKLQACVESKLDSEDRKYKKELCRYTFAAVRNVGPGRSVNGGFLVLTPQPAMRNRLLRNYVQVGKYDNQEADQSFLTWQFSKDGPFPVQILPRKYNAFFPTKADEGKVNVVHEKLWSWEDELPKWLQGNWRKGWNQMLAFYDSDDFLSEREKDRKVPFERDDRSVDHHAAAHGARARAHQEEEKRPAAKDPINLPPKQRQILGRRNNI